MKNVKDIFVTKSCWLENDFLKIAKAPYVFEEIMPIELPFYYTMLAVDILKQYCKSNNKTNNKTN